MKPHLLLIILVLAQSSSAQEKEMRETPEEGYLRMSKNSLEEPKLLAKEMHPGDLREFRKLTLTSAKKVPKDVRQIFIETLFGDGADIEQLAELTDEEFYAAFLDAASRKIPPEARAQMRRMKVNPIGHVLEGKEKAHVVVRTREPTTGFTKVSVSP